MTIPEVRRNFIAMPLLTESYGEGAASGVTQTE